VSVTVLSQDSVITFGSARASCSAISTRASKKAAVSVKFKLRINELFTRYRPDI
jgi:hypothetical protein